MREDNEEKGKEAKSNARESETCIQIEESWILLLEKSNKAKEKHTFCTLIFMQYVEKQAETVHNITCIRLNEYSIICTKQHTITNRLNHPNICSSSRT